MSQIEPAMTRRLLHGKNGIRPSEERKESEKKRKRERDFTIFTRTLEVLGPLAMFCASKVRASTAVTA